MPLLLFNLKAEFFWTFRLILENGAILQLYLFLMKIWIRDGAHIYLSNGFAQIVISDHRSKDHDPKYWSMSGRASLHEPYNKLCFVGKLRQMNKITFAMKYHKKCLLTRSEMRRSELWILDHHPNLSEGATWGQCLLLMKTHAGTRRRYLKIKSEDFNKIRQKETWSRSKISAW